MRCLALVLAMAWASNGFAADGNGKYQMAGYGTRSCGQYVHDRRSGAEVALNWSDWMGGYLTAANSLTPNTWSYIPSDLEGVMVWLDSFCQAHPQSVFGVAAATALEEFYPGRTTRDPVH